MKKKLKKGAQNTKPVTKTEQCDSFFNFFNPPQVPEEDDLDQETVAPLASTNVPIACSMAYWSYLFSRSCSLQTTVDNSMQA